MHLCASVIRRSLLLFSAVILRCTRTSLDQCAVPRPFPSIFSLPSHSSRFFRLDSISPPPSNTIDTAAIINCGWFPSPHRVPFLSLPFFSTALARSSSAFFDEIFPIYTGLLRSGVPSELLRIFRGGPAWLVDLLPRVSFFPPKIFSLNLPSIPPVDTRPVFLFFFATDGLELV